ncbi:MAG: DedA family protein [Bacteroidetes bacterium]|nr:MAG: DedA family protein [Bacteroidota bacterium]REK00426.1 MAG: DedA family protein [Bacteroidota bacterium]REK05067.1 MAG: DedA family protein [Bacteroidota bacterium]REK35544.1 MAG: DedA family protein [Bacteroidota bacterium]REK51646.1 MAG: DedA family protein [Bacteroidota bacterium]
MEYLSELAGLLTDSEKILAVGGLTLLLIIIFVETGMFFGFMFPGDPLLFTAGILCGTQDLAVNIFLLLVTVTIAAIAGNLIGYASGRFLDKKLANKPDSFFFKKKHLELAHAYYAKHGGKSLVAARFLPVIRTFAPIIAGTVKMDFWKFKFYNVFGAFLWVWTLVPLGYFLGHRFPGIIHQLEYIIIGIMVVTGAIFVKGYLKLRKKNS